MGNTNTIRGNKPPIWEYTQQDMSGTCNCPDEWTNEAYDVCQEVLGRCKYEKRLNRSNSVGMTSKARLQLDLSKIKKSVQSARWIAGRHEAVGAVGYAVVRDDERIPQNDFFTQGRRFWLRMRHSSYMVNNPAECGIREAAIKFEDRNDDGPLDLVLQTGRCSLASTCRELAQLADVKTPGDLQKLCLKKPRIFYALVDALRVTPDSYANLRYYSGLPYKLKSGNDKPRMVKFRLVPVGQDAATEPGLLTTQHQKQPWAISVSTPHDYDLVKDFETRLKGKTIQYVLQIQVHTIRGEDIDSLWNPQLQWNEDEYPWITLADITMTTTLSITSLLNTYFNINNKPKCLHLATLNNTSTDSTQSYPEAVTSLLTTLEEKHVQQFTPKPDCHGGSTERTETLIVGVCSSVPGNKDCQNNNHVEIRVSVTGVNGRCTPQKLGSAFSVDESDDGNISFYHIRAEDIGELLTMNLGVRYRHLHEEWFLHYVTITNMDKTRTCFFPCFSIVRSRVTLRRGDASLPQNEIDEVLRQERQLETVGQNHNYLWHKQPRLPSTVKAQGLVELPDHERLLAERYYGVNWDIMPSYEAEIAKKIKAHSVTKKQKTSGPLLGRPATHRCMSVEEVMKKANITRPFRSRMAPRSFSVSSTCSVPCATPTAPPVHATTPRRLSENDAPITRRLSEEDVASLGKVHEDEDTVLETRDDTTSSPSTSAPSTSARARWRKLHNVIGFINSVSSQFTDVGQKEMVSLGEDDARFGQRFLSGPNPTLIRRCDKLPCNLPVTDQHVLGCLRAGTTLQDAAQDGYLYIANYELLHQLVGVVREGERRYVEAAICLLYETPGHTLIPIAIQLGQDPELACIWTPSDSTEEWLAAKLWVLCADFHYHFLVTHYLRCHVAMDPFAIAIQRQLSSTHPVFKLLRPYFRYVVCSNTLMREKLMKKGGPVDRHTALGVEGITELLARAWAAFTLDSLDLERDLADRGVDNPDHLPTYLYREDGLQIWNATKKHVTEMVDMFYQSDDDVRNDNEIQAWLLDTITNGFPGKTVGFPQKLDSRGELTDILTKLIFTVTGLHSATHSHALDLYGFLPNVPAMMRQPPPSVKGRVTKQDIRWMLPEQNAYTYLASMYQVVVRFSANEEQKSLVNARRSYFVQAQGRQLEEKFSEELRKLSRKMYTTKACTGITYNRLSPENIACAIEPVPFKPAEMAEAEACACGLDIDLSGLDYIQVPMGNSSTMPLLAVPLCVSFAKCVGGKSYFRRQLSMQMVNSAMSGVNMHRVDVPMSAVHRRRHAMSGFYNGALGRPMFSGRI